MNTQSQTIQDTAATATGPAGPGPIQLPEGGLQLAATGLCELLRDLAQPAADANSDPGRYVRVANSLARLTRSILQIQQYRDVSARARLAMEPMKDPHRKLTESEARAIVEKVDELLGLNIEPRDPYEFDPRKRKSEPEVPPQTTEDSRLKTEDRPLQTDH